MDKLIQLLHEYSIYDPTSEEFLNANYFNEVFAEYKGLVKKTMEIHINEFEAQEDAQHGYIKQFDTKLHWDIQSQDEAKLHLNRKRPTIVRIIIKIRNSDLFTVARHSNLIIIDSHRKIVRRFEPMASHVYRDHVDKPLRIYFESYLPGYQYKQINIHPQLMEHKKQGGMCVAYVIKAAALAITHQKIEFPGTPQEVEEDISRFAASIMTLYAEPQSVDKEYGFGHILGGVLGLTALSALVGGVAYPGYGYGYGYPYYGYPSYGYGYGYSPRYYGGYRRRSRSR
jgi:hypothetical protein